MYSLPQYIEKDPQVVAAFMRQHPFAVLTGSDADGNPVATQVPILIREEAEKFFFRGHIMRQTDHHKAFLWNPKVLVLFTGPHTYVSASWYTNPKQGSTWNYITVQARGRLRFLEETALLQILQETTTLFEANPHSPASFDQLPDEYVQRLVKAIVGFEIEVTELNNVFKLSQNRDEGSYHAIIGKLENGTEDAQRIAGEMKQRSSQLFKPRQSS